MMEYLLYIPLFFFFFILSYQDWRHKELNVRTQIAAAITFFIIGSYLNGIFIALIMLAGGFLIGWLFYYLKVWEGGDSKVFMIYAMAYPISLAWVFVSNIAFCVLLYWGVMKLRKTKEVPLVPAISIAALITLLGVEIIRLIL